MNYKLFYQSVAKLKLLSVIFIVLFTLAGLYMHYCLLSANAGERKWKPLSELTGDWYYYMSDTPMKKKGSHRRLYFGKPKRDHYFERSVQQISRRSVMEINLSMGDTENEKRVEFQVVGELAQEEILFRTPHSEYISSNDIGTMWNGKHVTFSETSLKNQFILIHPNFLTDSKEESSGLFFR